MRFLTGTRLLLLLLASLVALAAPATVAAQGGDAVIRDCADDGDLDGDYSQDELDDAYDNLPSDIDQYSNCREVIERARERAGGGTNNAAGSAPGESTPGGPTGGDGAAGLGGSGNDAEELERRGERSRNDEAPTADVGGEQVGSSGGTLATDDDSDGMPAPLIVALVLAALAAVGGGVYLLRDRLSSQG
jgi:hypothetical protein